MAAERCNLLHPEDNPRMPHVTQLLKGRKGPAIAATDYMRSFADQIRPYINDRKFTVLGTDGFGRSDTRSQLRKFFEVNRYYVVVSALKALADDGQIQAKLVSEAIKKYGIDPSKPAPWTV
jgi:pyruvate dehydrogenase E1 component